MYSDDDDFDDETEGGPIVVEVTGTGSRHSPVSARRSPASARRPHRNRARHREEDISEESEEDEEDMEDDDHELHTARKSPGRQRSARNYKSANGRRSVNMTPPDRLLKSALKKADKFGFAGKADKAIHERIRILALCRIVYGSSHWKLAEAHVNLAEDYLELKSYHAQAEYHSENAMVIMQNSVTTTSGEREKADVFEILFRLNYILGKAKMAFKKLGEADTALLKADRAYQALSKLSCVTDDECDEMEIKLSEATARLSWRQKKYAVAGTQFDKVIDLTRRRYGDDAIELILVYQEFGRFEQSKGRHANHEKAIELFLQAHSIAGANYDNSSIELIDTALALAKAYASTGREEAESSAEKYLEECLSSCNTVYGPDHKKTLEVQDELARLLIRTQREHEALEMLRSSISLKNEAYGDYSEQVSDTYKMMGSIHLTQGSIEKALRCYKKCQNIENLVLGKNHKKSKDTERTIDILMASPGLSKKFVLSKNDELKNRPRFNAVSKPKP